MEKILKKFLAVIKKIGKIRFVDLYQLYISVENFVFEIG